MKTGADKKRQVFYLRGYVCPGFHSRDSWDSLAHLPSLPPWLLLYLLLACCFPEFALPQDRQAIRKEEKLDYYKKWLEQDVAYIITDEEKGVFLKLTSEQEREQFIEQFWFRRDPDPRTSMNEYKEEHYRRNAYANENFGSGIAGWKTDRGRVYITFGPPDVIEDHPSGGWYYRPAHEGGGATSTYPFQIWTYNHIEGVGSDIDLEFVDPSWSGEYRMALEPWEKDALLHVGFMGPTDRELEGSLSKLDRPYFSPGNYRNTRMQRLLGMRMKDKPFERLIQFYKVQEAPIVRYTDLKQVVTTNISYSQLPFRISYSSFPIDSEQVLVPITLEIENRNLTFEPGQQSGIQRGQINIYGVVQNLTGRIIKEFEDTLILEFPDLQLEARRTRKSMYQKQLFLPPGLYKLTLAAKDDHSAHVGTLQTGLVLRALQKELDASPVILARSLVPLETVPDSPQPFLLGDLKVIPNVSRVFHKGDDIGLYLQVYNAAVDQSTLQPELEVEYHILREGKILRRYLDPKSNSIIDYGDRFVVVHAFDLSGLTPGAYTLRVNIRDRVGKATLQRQVDFSVTG